MPHGAEPPTLAMPIRAVIFDFNGVLVDDEHVHFALFREVLAAEGIALTEAAYHERYLGFDDRGCFETALRDAGHADDRARVSDLIARKAELYATVAETGLRFFPGAADCLAALAARWPLAICSGALRPEIEFALTRLQCRDLVDVIVSAEDTNRCKPDPEGYRLALDTLGRRPPFRAARASLAAAECLVIEDSLAGIASARAAGMRGVGIAHTYAAAALEAAGAEAVLPGLTPLTPDWIDARFGGNPG